MSIRDRIQVTQPKTLRVWLDGLSAENRAVVDGWLADPNVPNAQIVRAIREDDPESGFVGFRVSPDTIRKYRNGTC